MSLDMNSLQQWIGKKEEQTDLITLAPMQALAATLDRSDTSFNSGSPLPPLWHWAYFLSPTNQSELALDGHPKKGGFLPPISLPRRMWAGSRFQFKRPLLAGQKVRRLSTIKNIELKQGRSGELAFVCVQHEIENDMGVALVEHHDIVYRDNPSDVEKHQTLPAGVPAPDQQSFSLEINPDPVLLFRYSAVTFNSHRIHYDRDYVNSVEGYPGLIVHGPLLATLLVELLQVNLPECTLKKFEFKAIRPVFDNAGFTVCGLHKSATEVDLWIKDHEGFLCMQACAEIDPNAIQSTLL
jgi:3-methylfumaryl-CoA hydratase